MSCGVGCRCVLDPALPWLWHRPVAIAPNRPLTWELPYAMGAALKRKKKRKEKKTNYGCQSKRGVRERNKLGG